jgi:serine/threonine protein kinase
MGIEHGDISIGNLMYDLDTKRGVLNDFDLARLSAPDRTRSSKDNTGTLPFLALDLLNERALSGGVRRLYRHDAESFTWCLIYICICMSKDGKGKISTLSPHPLSSWFIGLDQCYSSKSRLANDGLLGRFPLHHKIKPLVAQLYNCWKDRYSKQSKAGDLAELEWDTVAEGLPVLVLPPQSVESQRAEPYEELSDCEWFKQIYNLILRTSGVIPKSRFEDFFQMVNHVTTLYPFATPTQETEANN